MTNKITFYNIEELNYAKKEAFNSLRTNLQFCGANIKTVLFTSVSPSEGKSFTAFELARSEAENGKKVILIDADLRKSDLQGKYRVKSDTGDIRGLSHYLSNQARMYDVIYETNIPGFDIILIGHLSPNPTELLSGKLFENLIVTLEEKYDIVLIDSPPLGSVIDAAIIAPYCDGAIMVIESNTTSFRAAEKIKKQLEMAGCNILGAVLNKVKVKNTSYYKYYEK